MFDGPLDIRTRSMPEKFGGEMIFNPARIATLKEMLVPHFDANNMLKDTFPFARLRWEWNNRVMSHSNAYVPMGPLDPFYVPGSYTDGEGAQDAAATINNDMSAAVELALRWRILGDPQDGFAVIRILKAWGTLKEFSTLNDSRLVWCNRWPIFIEAASMVRDHPAYDWQVHASLQDVTRRALFMSTTDKTNNWATWGVCFEMAAAAFLNDRKLFDRAIYRWRTVFDAAVVNNIPVTEIYRQGANQGDGRTGLWYSNYFVLALTCAAEYARSNGEWLYDYSNKDSSFKGLYENVRHWTRYPAPTNIMTYVNFALGSVGHWVSHIRMSLSTEGAELKARVTQAGNSGVRSEYYPVRQGDTVSVRLRLRKPGTAIPARAAIRFDNGVFIYGDYVNTAEGFTEYTVSGPVPQGASTAAALFFVTGALDDNVFMADDAELRIGGYPYNSSGTPTQTVRNLAHDFILGALWPSPEGSWIMNQFATGSDREFYGIRCAVPAYYGRPLYG